MWYVIFCDSNRPESKWMRPGFRHCYAMRNDYGAVWTRFNPCRSHIDISQELVSDYPTIQDYVTDAETYLAYNGKPCDVAHSLSVVSCVGAVKYLLGIQAPFVLTPYQLYKHLQRLQ